MANGGGDISTTALQWGVRSSAGMDQTSHCFVITPMPGEKHRHIPGIGTSQPALPSPPHCTVPHFYHGTLTRLLGCPVGQRDDSFVVAGALSLLHTPNKRKTQNAQPFRKSHKNIK